MQNKHLVDLTKYPPEYNKEQFSRTRLFPYFTHDTNTHIIKSPEQKVVFLASQHMWTVTRYHFKSVFASTVIKMGLQNAESLFIEIKSTYLEQNTWTCPKTIQPYIKAKA